MSRMEKPTPTLQSIDPFVFAVIKDATGGTDSLLTVATSKVQIPLTDLRRLNPQLDNTAADVPLPEGTLIQLPVAIRQWHFSHGVYFSIKAEEEALRQCDDDLDQLVRAYENEHSGNSNSSSSTAASALALPPRKVFSKTEQLTSVIEAEATRQLPLVMEKFDAVGKREQLLQYLVDVDAVRQKEREVEAQFSPSAVQLRCFAEGSAGKATDKRTGRWTENHLSPSTLQTVPDTEEDFCMAHTHRWEWVFTGVRTQEIQESWAVLSCQKLTVLFDAFTCSGVFPPPHSRNAFLFIAGTFYIDDRHRGEPDFEDLSANIRHLDPLRFLAASGTSLSPVEVDGEGMVGRNSSSSTGSPPQSLPPTARGESLGFGRCPVRSAAHTTFGELQVKLGEYGVFRHRGSCDHFFYLDGVRSLRGLPRTSREQFPHRVMKRREVAMRCHMCRQFPATVALYGDALSPENPTVYCPVCYELLHGEESEEDAKKYLKVVPEKPGDYFTF